MLAVIRIRGSANRSSDVKETMSLLGLASANHCVLLPEDSSHKGMLKKVENFITWGEASKEIEEELRKRGSVARLHPPTKGFKSIKLPFPRGDLGYRGDKINDLLRRML